MAITDMNENVSLNNHVPDEKTFEESGDTTYHTKVCVFNLGKWTEKKDIEEMLAAIPLKYRNIQKSRKVPYGFISFDSQEERDASLEVLNTTEFKGNVLNAKPACPKKSVQPLKRGRSPGFNNENNDEKRSKGEKTINEDDIINNSAADAVAPWQNIPYKTQLDRKEHAMKKVIVKICRKTRQAYIQKAKRKAEHEKKQSKKTHADSEKAPIQFPLWLDADGNLFAVSDNKLYSKANKSDIEEWRLCGEAPGILGVFSWNGDLIGHCTKGRLHHWNQKNEIWNEYPEECQTLFLTALTSFRGELYGCASDGKIYKTSSIGSNMNWSEVISFQVSTAMIAHDGFLYVIHENRKKLSRASLNELPALKFNFAPEMIENREITCLASHDGVLIVGTSTSEVLYFKNDTCEIHKANVQNIVGITTHKGLCCDFGEIIPSPSQYGYRNKCQFSVGYDVNGKPCVGFRNGLYRNGSITVENPFDCSNVPDCMKTVCKVFQKFIEASEFGVYDREKHCGVWRTVLARSCVRSSGLLVMIEANPKGIDAQVWENEINRLKSEMLSIDSPRKITSLFIQEYEGSSTPGDDHPVKLIAGDDHIVESLLDLKFRISPQAFFQVNTLAAEVLYSKIRDLVGMEGKRLIYDVCCGTGTIALCIAAACGETNKVVGIEICKAATEDAEKNASLNKIEGVTFVNSKAETVMGKLLNSSKEILKDLDGIVAVVDPPRAGLHLSVLKALRSCRAVSKIVYVSCNPTVSLIEDASRLCGPQTSSISGDPFTPEYAVPVDLFPGTEHCELVVVFKR